MRDSLRAFVSTEKNTSPWTYIEENLGDMTGMERYHRCAECMEYPHSKGFKVCKHFRPMEHLGTDFCFFGLGWFVFLRFTNCDRTLEVLTRMPITYTP